jgi:hypothetical protein
MEKTMKVGNQAESCVEETKTPSIDKNETSKHFHTFLDTILEIGRSEHKSDCKTLVDLNNNEAFQQF